MRTLFLVLVVAGATAALAQEDVAAHINGEVLTWKQVRERLRDLKPEQVTPQLLQATRQELVGSILIRQYADRNHLTVSPAEVDDAVERDRKRYATAEEHRRGINVYYGSLSNYKESLGWTLRRAKVLDHAVAAMKDAGFSPAAIPEEDLRRYYESHSDYFRAVEQISFVRIGLDISGPGAEAQKQAIAESLLRRLEKGTDFFMLAYFYSDVRRAREFRDRGVTRKDLKGIYGPETIDTLFDVLKQGETSAILRDGKTLNIFRMEQKLKQEAETFEEAKARIRPTLEAGIRDSNYSKLVQALRRSGQIEPADVFEEK